MSICEGWFSSEDDWMSNETPVAGGQSYSCDSVEHKSEQAALIGPQNSFQPLSAASFTLVHSFDVMCRDDFPSWLGEECLTDCNEVSSLMVRDSFTADFTVLLQ